MPNIPIETLQKADKVLGLVACAAVSPIGSVRRFRSRCGSPERHVERVLLVKFWGIGSLQLLTPAVGVLRRRHPGARLTLLTLAENAAFARGLGAWDEVVTLDIRGAGWLALAGRFLGLVRGLHRRRFDVVYDFEFFTRFSAVVSALTSARSVHGFRAPSVWRGGVHTRTVPFNRYWHVARNFRALAGGEDGEDVTPAEVLPFRIEAASAAHVESLLASLRPGSAGPLVVLNPNAGRLSLERRWPPERFGELARRLATELGATVVFIGARSESQYTRAAAALAAGAPHGHVHSLAGALTIAGLVALLDRADVVVSNDSGPMHVAAALGTPTLGLFGPETPVMYRPLGRRARVLWRPPICSPCINVHDNKVANCIHGRPECLVNITVDMVLAATMKLLEGETLVPAAPPRAPQPLLAHEPMAPSAQAPSGGLNLPTILG